MPFEEPQVTTGARYIAESFDALGVSHVFFMDAILRPTLVEMEELGIARILAHSEKAAAYMADGYARVSGKVGVCMAQSVGAANLAAGLQDAYLHRAPVVAITGRKEAGLRYRNAYQEVPHTPLFASVTKASMDVSEVGELPGMLAQAFRMAADGSPRPVHLDLNGLGGEVIERGMLTAPPLPEVALGALPVHRPLAPPAMIDAAAARLAASKRPVMVVGAGAIQAGAEEAVRRFAESCRIPVATSLGGRGIVPTTHPLHIGTVGTYSAPPGNRLVSEADLVIFIGCHAGDQPTNAYTVPAQGTAIIQIDLDGSEIGRNYPGVTGVQGCPRQAVTDLAARVTADPDWAGWAEHAASVFATWRDEIEPFRRSDARPIRVERLCREISEALPANGVLVADTGYSGIWTATVLDLPSPDQSYLRAAGSLGWSFPAALGAQLGAPDRPTVCFTGDGAFYYHLPELETQRRWQIPLVTVVNNNSGFGQGVYKVKSFYEGRSGSPEEINRFGPTDFAAIARDFGVDGIRIEDPADLAPTLERAIAARKPALIDVVTDIDPRAPEPWNPAA
ncbi:thiamine pyrophosphate-binding protein [Tropicimonas sp. IMCC6043]|uniref:thiamine pyrophosphate-binding protein n=1 Tax=Tropicimonas sp. IMCC6043 TaxID=2510645 RepID=UPI00101D56D1|nr:thiamine pyrophosphate-binding protein [Tropicimonas sp. IMCC6043]RYH12289.1 thiamine pyrophosphate-binding protein [Tropicimonas sp. IMCC6043]